MRPSHPLEALSIEAVRYGQELGPLDIPALAARLYHYNTQPGSASILASLMALDQAAASGALGTVVASERDSPTGLVAASLDYDWARWAPASTADLGSGGDTGLGAQETHDRPSAQFKLYISPAVTELRDTLQILSEVLPHVEALAFKRARGTALLRPDKAVLHVASWEKLIEAARILRQALRGIVPQGVPFTAPLFDDMLISWGVDPSADTRVANSVPMSWRSWVTTRLAEELAEAMNDRESGCEPWEAALIQLAHDDIEIPAFSPSESLTGPRLAEI